MRTKKTKGFRRFIKKICITTVFLSLMALVAFTYYDRKLQPAVETLAVSQVQDIATRIVNESVCRELPEYGEFVYISRAETGKINSVNIDHSKINLLRASLALDVLDELAHISEESVVHIPIGTLLGYEIFSATGPYVDVRILPTTSVFTSYRSEFVSSGINQTLHRITVSVCVTATVIMPSGSQELDYTVDTVVSETVIVGDVPSVYGIIGDDTQRLYGKEIIS